MSHVVHNDLFETVTQGKGESKGLKGLMPQKSQWQTKTGFVEGQSKEKESNEGARSQKLGLIHELLPTPEQANEENASTTETAAPEATPAAPEAATWDVQANEGALAPTMRQRRRQRRKANRQQPTTRNGSSGRQRFKQRNHIRTDGSPHQVRTANKVPFIKVQGFRGFCNKSRATYGSCHQLQDLQLATRNGPPRSHGGPHCLRSFVRSGYYVLS